MSSYLTRKQENQLEIDRMKAQGELEAAHDHEVRITVVERQLDMHRRSGDKP